MDNTNPTITGNKRKYTPAESEYESEQTTSDDTWSPCSEEEDDEEIEQGETKQTEPPQPRQTRSRGPAVYVTNNEAMDKVQYPKPHVINLNTHADSNIQTGRRGDR